MLHLVLNTKKSLKSPSLRIRSCSRESSANSSKKGTPSRSIIEIEINPGTFPGAVIRALTADFRSLVINLFSETIKFESNLKIQRKFKKF